MTGYHFPGEDTETEHWVQHALAILKGRMRSLIFTGRRGLNRLTVKQDARANKMETELVINSGEITDVKKKDKRDHCLKLFLFHLIFTYDHCVNADQILSHSSYLQTKDYTFWTNIQLNGIPLQLEKCDLKHYCIHLFKLYHDVNNILCYLVVEFYDQR